MAVLFILLAFKNIQAVVESALAPSIEYISGWLNLSESVAAVTLLAVANGAGDVITAFVASVDKGGLEYNIGAIFGAGMFVCSVVVAATIFLSETDI